MVTVITRMTGVTGVARMTKDHRHCNGDFGDQDDQGGWEKVNE